MDWFVFLLLLGMLLIVVLKALCELYGNAQLVPGDIYFAPAGTLSGSKVFSL